jgi:hypothetical protein
LAKVKIADKKKDGDGGIGFAAVEPYYRDALRVLNKAMDGGVANSPMGLFGLFAFYDLYHGGAYAAPINERPFHMGDGGVSSKYAHGDLNNKYTEGLGGVLFQAVGGGNSGADLANEVLEDANVPHVLPKLISDEAYAQFKYTFAQFSTADLFQNVGTGLRVYVQSGEDVMKALPKLEKTVTAATTDVEAGLGS